MKVYYPVHDYANNVLVIWNRRSTLQQYISAVDWETLTQVLDISDVKSASSSSTSLTGGNHQQQYQDFGFTSLFCTSRVTSMNGVAKPMLKPNILLDPTVVQCFIVGSKMSRHVHLP
jgi:hypothetical protein